MNVCAKAILLVYKWLKSLGFGGVFLNTTILGRVTHQLKDGHPPAGLHKTGIRGIEDTGQIFDSKTNDIKDKGNKLGQRQSQTPFSSAFWVQKSVGSKQVLVAKKNLGPKKFWDKKILGQKEFCVQKNLVKKMFWTNKKL